MPVFDELQNMKFAGIDFPVTSVSIRGGARLHKHEYPKRGGQLLEKIGRKAYEVEIRVPFHASFPKWPGLWPDTWYELRTLFEEQHTGPLLIPHVGTVLMCAESWNSNVESKRRSGEDVEIKFIEDNTSDFLVENLISVKQTNLSNQAAAFATEAGKLPSKPDIFAAIQQLADSIQGLFDQKELYGNLLLGKIESIKQLIKRADADVDALQNPVNIGLFEALRELHDSVLSLEENLLSSGPPLVSYVVPKGMTLGAISTELYGVTSRGGEILGLNSIDDPYFVPAGTKLNVFAP